MQRLEGTGGRATDGFATVVGRLTSLVGVEVGTGVGGGVTAAVVAAVEPDVGTGMVAAAAGGSG
jgi:hypothetical protein